MKLSITIPLISFLFGTFCSRAWAGPPNDNFANRTVLSGTNITLQGDNSGATTEPGENTELASEQFYGGSVWYEWTAPTNGVVYLSGAAEISNFYFDLVCYHGSSVSNLTAVPQTPDGGFGVNAGDVLEIEVASIYYALYEEGGATGPFTLTLLLVPHLLASPNDTFANRPEITTPTYEFDGSIYGATNEPGEPFPSGLTQTLWWDFSPPGNGILQLTTPFAQFTPTFTVYNGNQFASMTPITPTNGLFPLQAGQDYSIQLASSYVSNGAFTLVTRFYSLTNDTFATSDQVEGTNITYYGNFTLATLEPGEPVTGASNTVWMSWTAPATGYAQVNLAGGTAQRQYFAAYTGSSVDALQLVPEVGIGNSVYQFLATQGTVYHFQFSGGSDNFVFYLLFQLFGPCSNDNFADAQVVKGQTVYYAPKSVEGATMELGEPQHMGNVPQQSIWWTWQAPLWGYCYLNPLASLAPNYVIAVYTGDSVEALTLVAKATNSDFRFPVTGGQTYHIAAAVPTNTVGNIVLNSDYSPLDTSVHIVPGNLLQEPSWEGTGVLGAQYWHWTGTMGGYVGEPGDVDGTTWPVLNNGTVLWQTFPTIPGHKYTVKFAYLIGGPLSPAGADARVAVSWGTNQLGISVIPQAEAGFWHWDSYTATAADTNSQITFSDLGGNVEMDAFSVVDATLPPSIVNQPVSLSAFLGGTAALIVGVNGSSPLSYQWFFDGFPLTSQTNKTALLNITTAAQAGNYFVVITNAFGAVTSAVASLTVNAAITGTILSQPYGDTIPVGGYFDFSVVAAGPPPLSYQWYANGNAIAGATNNSLMLTNIQLSDAGSYQVTVQNPQSIVLSLPATLSVDASASGGGEIQFQNFFRSNGSLGGWPVFDVDGVTHLSGSNYVAQLYAGPSLELLRPAAQPAPFQTGVKAGYFVTQLVTLGNVPPGSNAVIQVCAWDATYGTSYEQARATSGRVGKSGILQVIAGGVTAAGSPILPASLQAMPSFSLQAGLPYFEVGIVRFDSFQPPNTFVWSLQGQAGSIYLIEKSTRTDRILWQPFTVITNVTGTVNFTDTVDLNTTNSFYRARILD